jgi:hypothetical protein
MTEEEIMQLIDADSAAKTEAVRAMLMEMGRLDVLAEFDAKMRDIRLGIDSARGCWHALSGAQRRTLEVLGTGRRLIRDTGYLSRYNAYGEGQPILNVCGRPTLQNLVARDWPSARVELSSPWRKPSSANAGASS